MQNLKRGLKLGITASASGHNAASVWKRPKPLSEAILEPAKIVSSLSRAEREELAECEARLGDLLDAWVAAGEALAKIRAQRLYRDQYDTFEQYTRDQWGIGDAHAHRLIDGAEVMAVLSPIGETKHMPLPTCEAQVRPLTSVPKAKLLEVWQKVAKQAQGRVSAKLVTQVAKPFQQQTRGRSSKKAKGDDDKDMLRKQLLACLGRLRSLLRGSTFEKEAEGAVRKLEQLIR